MSFFSPVQVFHQQRLRALWLAFLLAVAGPAVGQQPEPQNAVVVSNESLQRLSTLQQELENLESEFGPFDERLLEVLGAIEEELGSQGRDEEVVDLQGRRLQILRMAIGLESLALLPVLEDSLDTRLRLGDWSEASDLLAHMRYLQTLNFGENSEAVVDAMGREATLHLARVSVGDRRSRATNFMDARDLYRDILDIAEERFGERDRRLVPALYLRAFNLQLLVQVLNSGASMAGVTIDELIERDGSARLTTFGRPGVFDPNTVLGPRNRIPVVEAGELVGLSYLRQALGFVDDIREIAEAEGDREMLALATLYHGDYQLLMGRGSGRADYRDALEQLRAIGFEDDRLEAFFSRPMVIPVETFFTRFEDLENYQQRLQAASATVPDAEGFLGVFPAWNEDLRAIRRPTALDSLVGGTAATGEVTLEFSVNSRGQVSSVDILSAQPDETGLRNQARRAMREVRFRPALIDGSPDSFTDATMIYRSPLED